MIFREKTHDVHLMLGLILKTKNIPLSSQLSNKYSSSQMTFKGCNWTWFRPTTLDELLKLKNEYPDAPVIMGNTIAGIYLTKICRSLCNKKVFMNL